MRPFVAIDLGGTNLRGALVSHTGKILARAHLSTGSFKDRKGLMAGLKAVVDQLSAQSLKGQVAGVGIASPGPCDLRKGLLLSTPNLPKGRPLPMGPNLGAYLNCPWVLENDVNAGGLGEYWLGAGQSYNHVTGFFIGTGLGGFAIIDGKVVAGHHLTGGELGHMIVADDGLRCGCGNKGCLEAYVSAVALTRRFKKMTGQTKAPIEIYKLAKAGHRQAVRLVKDTHHMLALGVVSVANIFNPQIMIIGGGVARAGNQMLTPLRKEVKDMHYRVNTRSLKIVRSKLGDDANILGAVFRLKQKLAGAL